MKEVSFQNLISMVFIVPQYLFEYACNHENMSCLRDEKNKFVKIIFRIKQCHCFGGNQLAEMV